MIDTDSLTDLRSDGEDHITFAIREAVRRAIQGHYESGDPIVIWRDGQVVHVPPEEIPALLAASDAAQSSGSPAHLLDAVTSHGADR